jgi:hypothetical protein
MQVFTKESAQKMRESLLESQKYVRNFDLVRRFVAKASTTNMVEIPIPSEGDAQILGYNIVYQKPTGANPDVLFIRMQTASNGKNWSNDFIPVRAIAAPGISENSRFGFRKFEAYCPKNDKINIEYQNTSNEDLEITIVMFGNVWYQF